MKNDNFDRLVSELSGQVEQVRAEEVKILVKQARYDNLKRVGISVVFVLLGALVYLHYDEINGRVTKMFTTKEPEYQGILKIADEVETEKPGTETGPVDPNSRKARLKDAMMRAKQHAALVDEVMDFDSAAAKPSPTPALVVAPDATKTSIAPSVAVGPVAKQ